MPSALLRCHPTFDVAAGHQLQHFAKLKAENLRHERDCIVEQSRQVEPFERVLA